MYGVDIGTVLCCVVMSWSTEPGSNVDRVLSGGRCQTGFVILRLENHASSQNRGAREVNSAHLHQSSLSSVSPLPLGIRGSPPSRIASAKRSSHLSRLVSHSSGASGTTTPNLSGANAPPEPDRPPITSVLVDHCVIGVAPRFKRLVKSLCLTLITPGQ